MCSTPSLRRSPNIAFETVPICIWSTMALSRPFNQDCRALLLSTPFTSRQSMVWCPWPCNVLAGSVSSFSTLKVLSDTSHLWWLLCPPVYLLGHFPITLACPGQCVRRCFRRWMSTIDARQSWLPIEPFTICRPGRGCCVCPDRQVNVMVMWHQRSYRNRSSCLSSR